MSFRVVRSRAWTVRACPERAQRVEGTPRNLQFSAASGSAGCQAYESPRARSQVDIVLRINGTADGPAKHYELRLVPGCSRPVSFLRCANATSSKVDIRPFTRTLADGVLHLFLQTGAVWPSTLPSLPRICDVMVRSRDVLARSSILAFPRTIPALSDCGGTSPYVRGCLLIHRFSSRLYPVNAL